MRAGNIPIKFSDGKTRWIPARFKEAVLAEFPDAEVVEPGWKSWARAGLDAAPATGGMAGGIIGGVAGAPGLALGPAGVLIPATMGVAGAGLGGSAGQTIRELGYRAMGEDAPGTVGGAAREQATAQTVGELGGPLVSAGAKAAYTSLLSPSVRAMKEFPQLAKAAWEIGFPIERAGTVSPGAEALRRSSSDKAKLMIRQAGRPSVTTQMARQHDFLPPPQMPAPPNMADVAGHSAATQRFTDAVTHVANRVGIEPQDLFGLVREPSLRPIDLAEAFQKHGLTHGDIAALRRMMPAGIDNPNPILTRMAHDVEPVRLPAIRRVKQKRIPLSEILDGLDKLEAKYSGDPTDDAANAIRAYRQKVESKWNPAGDPNKGINYRNTNKIKQGAQRAAKAARASEVAGNDPAAGDSRSAAAQIVGRNARRALDSGKEGARVPGLNKQNAVTQKAINVGKALKDAPYRHGMNPEYTLPAIIGGAGYLAHQAPLPTALTMLGTSLAFGTQKPLMSKLALTLGKNPAAQAAIRQTPRVLDYLGGYPFNPSEEPQ